MSPPCPVYLNWIGFSSERLKAGVSVEVRAMAGEGLG